MCIICKTPGEKGDVAYVCRVCAADLSLSYTAGIKLNCDMCGLCVPTTKVNGSICSVCSWTPYVRWDVLEEDQVDFIKAAQNQVRRSDSIIIANSVVPKPFGKILLGNLS